MERVSPSPTETNVVAQEPEPAQGRRAAAPETAPATAPTPSAPPPLTRDKLLLLATGLAGSFLIGLSGQFPNLALADIGGALGASPDAASWTSTAYLMGNLVGVVLAIAMIQTFGLRRFLTVNTAVFAVAGLGGALTTSLDLLVGLRAVQGVAAGGFGPAAFVAMFMTMGGPRLSLGATLLAFALTFPVVLAPVLGGFIEDRFGWRSLFLIQALIGLGLGTAVRAWFPRQPVAWERLKIDWAAVGLLSTGLAAAALVLSQGTRRSWFESDLVAGAAAVSLAALTGFAVTLARSSKPLINPSLLVRRDFGPTIGAYALFRFGLFAAVFLIPQFLIAAQGRRPVEVAGLMLWAAAAQAAAAPIVWLLMYRLEARVLMALGLGLCAAFAWLVGHGAGQAGVEALRLPLVLLGFGMALFMLPGLVVGARVLTPPDLPTASLTFNVATYGAGALGFALFAQLNADRTKVHADMLAQAVSLYRGQGADLASGLAVLDCFTVLAAVFVLTALTVAFQRRHPPLARQGAD